MEFLTELRLEDHVMHLHRGCDSGERVLPVSQIPLGPGR